MTGRVSLRADAQPGPTLPAEAVGVPSTGRIHAAARRPVSPGSSALCHFLCPFPLCSKLQQLQVRHGGVLGDGPAPRGSPGTANQAREQLLSLPQVLLSKAVLELVPVGDGVQCGSPVRLAGWCDVQRVVVRAQRAGLPPPGGLNPV